MKGFLKQYRRFIIFYPIMILLIIGIVMLDLWNQNASVSYGSILYILILSFVLFAIFLGFAYLSERKNYKALQEHVKDLHQPIHFFENSSYQFEEYNRILNEQYGLYIEDISKANEEKQRYSTFINQWVHQMKTPLSVISLLLQNAKQQPEHDTKLVRNIEEETDKLTKGLELVLHSSRLDLFHEDFKVERVSLTEIVREAIQEHKSAFIRSKVFPVMKIEQDYFVESDRKWLTFIINQIIVNAIKYTKNIGKQIQFYTKHEKNTLILCIQDDGIGIPSQDIRRVFQPFFTGQNGRKYAESTGMGLYLAKRTCDEIGHTIAIQSEEGKGTTIFITFYNMTSL